MLIFVVPWIHFNFKFKSVQSPLILQIVPDSIFVVPCIRIETQAGRGGMLKEKHGEGSVHEVQNTTKNRQK